MRSGEQKSAESRGTPSRVYPDDPDAHLTLGMAYLTMMGEVNVFRLISMAKQARAGWEKRLHLTQILGGLYSLFLLCKRSKSRGWRHRASSSYASKTGSSDAGYGYLSIALLQAKDENFDLAEANL